MNPLPIISPLPLDFPPDESQPTICVSYEEKLQAYQIALKLTQQGLSQKAIAQQLQRHPRTIRRWLRAGHVPVNRRRARRSLVDPYKSYLLQRWNAGCWNATQLYHEIREQGYSGGVTILREFVQKLRTAQGLDPHRRSLDLADVETPKLTPRRAVHLILMKPEERTSEEQQILDQILQLNTDIQQLVLLAQDFAVQLRQRQAERFDAWLQEALAFPLLQSFARGLQRDYDAVYAALSSNWSNGQTEGQINRLKFLKRQMYGRANFDLLRIRVLAA